ncbi:hypothetical protein DLAC_10934 [Tieghemostelium lacteum]|uniref:Uncharacterized protein n=1 Tax=Tieghemostelium lacteum TaxID=361077 RepID=A0A151Z2R0_TIELA|nr:hypothetical protein DLAC_10934 [Tieghemostelium lacteum]|eukprot:KYQ88245.1 hypothetical protein DLAC_10934 [Tieghemostelium lacteum]
MFNHTIGTQRHQVEQEVELKDHPIKEVELPPIKSFCSKWKDHSESEKTLQDYMVKEFKKLSNYPNNIYDISTKKLLKAKGSDCSPDWCISSTESPLHMSWFLGVGDTKLHNKEKNFPSNEASGRVLYYADFILNRSPLKKIHAFVTTGEMICFWSVSKLQDGTHTFSQYPPVFLAYNNNSPTPGFKYLLSLLNDNNQLIPKELLEKVEIEKDSIEYETEGLSSVVYSAKYKNEVQIIKVYKNVKAQENEMKMIKLLDSSEGITNILDYGKDWCIISPLGNIIDSTSTLENYRQV